MAYVPYQVELTISSARDLKNVNWRYGPLTPYTVVWVDPSSKHSTKVDDCGDTCPEWNDKIVIPLTDRIENSTLYMDIIHANAEYEIKPLIGSARVALREIVDEYGIGEWAYRSLKLKRPSGRPQGILEVKIVVRETPYHAPDPYYASPYGVPHGSRAYSYQSQDPYHNSYSAPPPISSPPAGYPYQYNATPPPVEYGTTREGYYQEGEGKSKTKKEKKFGIGTGIAVGAVAGVLGGLAIAEGLDHVKDKAEHKIDEEVDERVEADEGYGGGYGDYE